VSAENYQTLEVWGEDHQAGLGRLTLRACALIMATRLAGNGENVHLGDIIVRVRTMATIEHDENNETWVRRAGFTRWVMAQPVFSVLLP
jgi:hypothetical protein